MGAPLFAIAASSAENISERMRHAELKAENTSPLKSSLPAWVAQC
jgi:hypothetical protein